jgi:hypothetical protein
LLLKEGSDDADDQGCFHSLTKADNEGGQHQAGRPVDPMLCQALLLSNVRCTLQNKWEVNC